MQRAKPAAARDLEHDVGVAVDLSLRDTLALGRVGEVVGISDQHLDAGVFHSCSPLVSGDVVVDWRDAHASDGADHALVVLQLALLLEHPGDDAHHRTGVLLPEVQGLDVGVLEVIALGVGAGAVDDREVGARELARHGSNRLLHQEADADHEVIAGGGEVREVRDVVVAGLRLFDVALDVEVSDGLLKPDISEVVEALVVKTADVGDKADLVLLGGGRRGAAATCGRHHQRHCHETK